MEIVLHTTVVSYAYSCVSTTSIISALYVAGVAFVPFKSTPLALFGFNERILRSRARPPQLIAPGRRPAPKCRSLAVPIFSHESWLTVAHGSRHCEGLHSGCSASAPMQECEIECISFSFKKKRERSSAYPPRPFHPRAPRLSEPASIYRRGGRAFLYEPALAAAKASRE